VRVGLAGLGLIAVLLLASTLSAQRQPPSEKLVIAGKAAYTWSDKGPNGGPNGGRDVVQVEGPVTITLDRAVLTANDAVIWLTPEPNGAPGEQHADIALLGNAVVKQDTWTRSGPTMLVGQQVLSDVRIEAGQRVPRDMRDSALYKIALPLLEQARTQPVTLPPSSAASRPSSRPTSGPATRRSATTAPSVPVHMEAGQTDIVDTEDGTIALVVWDGVKIFARQPTGDTIELQARRAVLFTSMHSVKEATARDKSAKAKEKVTAVYLEGDARIEYDSMKPGIGEQRLSGERIYYELGTDRAILLDAVVHTVDLKQNVPLIVRARVLRQLSKGEFKADHLELTSSAFAVPSYSIAADRIYVREEATGDPRYPNQFVWQANNATFQAFDVPFFYLPYAAGVMGSQPGPLRGIGGGHRTDLGYEFMSEWGLFETLGKIPPRDLDVDYRVDYFTDRGPGFGLNADYGGGFVTEPGHEPFNFEGDFKSYGVYDKGIDENLARLPVKPGGAGDTPRGWALYEHQHFFPDDWEAQIRLGYVSDPTFLEEWFQPRFYQDLPTDTSGYLKRQRDTEAFTLLAEAQPNRFVTTSDRAAEQFEVERLPEVGYHRIGDDFGNAVTFFSDNTGGGYDFQMSRATLREQGYALPTISPGQPALGLTGTTPTPTWRGDLRQEIDWPLSAGKFKVVPFLVGRYTEYSNSPLGMEEHRFFGSAGVRLTTAFWKTDPTAQSDLFDIHQLRHIIEPEANLVTSGTTVDRSQLYLYDVPVDAINDTSVAEVGLRQRWQTQRGGPGRWRSVDVFTLDVDAEFYANKPARKFNQPTDFRGMFFSSLPETSIARNAVNTDASWRITDNTIILADVEHNLDESKLATAAIGVLVRRDVQESYYIGNRYIADLDSNITTVSAQYMLSQKYSLGFSQSFDFGLGKNVSSSVSVVRSFDRFIMSLALSQDSISRQTGFSFNIAPIGFGQGIGTSALQGPFGK
jgi:lipopolysaccharide assembly outer membrane protein LptD (OstA)